MWLSLVPTEFPGQFPSAYQVNNYTAQPLGWAQRPLNFAMVLADFSALEAIFYRRWGELSVWGEFAVGAQHGI